MGGNWEFWSEKFNENWLKKVEKFKTALGGVWGGGPRSSPICPKLDFDSRHAPLPLLGRKAPDEKFGNGRKVKSYWFFFLLLPFLPPRNVKASREL